MSTRQANELAPVNILLVDDVPGNLSSLEAVLSGSDYNLVLARSGPEALACVLRQEFAVILLDVAMPDMDGFELATIIKDREQSKLIPIIFVTASVYELEHIFHGYTVGAVDYLRKPIDAHQVRAKVAVFVELYRQRKQIERQAIHLREVELQAQRLLRERAEEALRESEALYQLTFEQAPIGIGHASPDGRWVRANARLCDILGCSPDDIVGQRVDKIADGNDEELLSALPRLEAGDLASYAHEHRLSSTAAGEIWGHVTISSLRDSVGRVIRLIVVIDDITARKRAEIERAELIRTLERSIQVRDEFLAIASHELRTPITPLRLQTASLLREEPRDIANEAAQGRLRRRLERIDVAAARVESLIDRLLDLWRLSVGELELELEEVDLRDLASTIVARLAEQTRHGSEITIHAPEPVLGRWDRLRMLQAVANLISNAIKFGKGAPIDVTVSTHGDRARLSVRDRGIGIPPAEQERIFERFERQIPIRHYGGFGVGLWVAREIVNAHGGQVTLRSRPGDGSEFTIELPRQPVRQRTTEATRHAPPGEAHP